MLNEILVFFRQQIVASVLKKQEEKMLKYDHNRACQPLSKLSMRNRKVYLSEFEEPLVKCIKNYEFLPMICPPISEIYL